MILINMNKFHLLYCTQSVQTETCFWNFALNCSQSILLGQVMIVFETFVRYLSITWDYYLLTVHLKYDQKTKVSMDLDCQQLRVKFQNKNLCQFEPIEYWRQAVPNLSKAKIAFILIKYLLSL